MAVAHDEPDAMAPAGSRGGRSFKPRYPGWLTSPSLLYYAVFFLGPMAILVAFSLATQTGFGAITYGFDTSQFRLIGDPLYLKIFQRTMLIAAAHNMPVESYPWRFSSVVSVGSHEEADPLVFYANPSPPVEFFARGVEVDVAWVGGGSIRATGNSFATPALSGIAALVLGKHPGLTPFQVKTVLSLIATNVGG